MLNEKVKNLFNSFRLRKRVLAATDAFIVVAAALFANWPLPVVAERIDRPELLIISVTCVFGCFAGLLFFGAYNKLWRYFSKRDYLSCIKGVVCGMAVAYGFVYLFQRQTVIVSVPWVKGENVVVGLYVPRLLVLTVFQIGLDARQGKAVRGTEHARDEIFRPGDVVPVLIQKGTLGLLIVLKAEVEGSGGVVGVFTGNVLDDCHSSC